MQQCLYGGRSCLCSTPAACGSCCPRGHTFLVREKEQRFVSAALGYVRNGNECALSHFGSMRWIIVMRQTGRGANKDLVGQSLVLRGRNEGGLIHVFGRWWVCAASEERLDERTSVARLLLEWGSGVLRAGTQCACSVFRAYLGILLPRCLKRWFGCSVV